MGNDCGVVITWRDLCALLFGAQLKPFGNKNRLKWYFTPRYFYMSPWVLRLIPHDNLKTVPPMRSSVWEAADTTTAMDRNHIQQPLFLLALIPLIGLCAANVSAQLPNHDQGTEEPVAVRPRLAQKPVVVVPEVKPGLTPPVYTDPAAALRSAKMIYVKSTSLFVGVPVIEAKLQKRSEFSHLCLVITRDFNEADLILVVEHDVFTKYTYTAIHKDTDIVVASGKLSSLGGTVAGKVAKRFLKQLVKARGSTSPGCSPKQPAT